MSFKFTDTVSSDEFMQAAQKVIVFSQLHAFITVARKNPTTMVQCQLPINQASVGISVSPAMILPQLLEEFQKLGNELEAHNISMTELLARLENNANAAS